VSGYILKETFPSFQNNYTVNKDMQGTPAYFSDGGNDAFDSWGYFQITNAEGTVVTNLPFTQRNGPDGTIYTEEFQHDGETWELKQGWVVPGIFAMQVLQITGEDKPFKFKLSGNYGSDSSSQYGRVTTQYGEVYLTTFWNNDGGKDAAGGDPQVTWTVVPYDPGLTATDVPPATSSRSGDNETGTTVAMTHGCLVFIQWGYTTVQAVQDFIIQSFERDNIIKYLVVDGTEVKRWDEGLSQYISVGQAPPTKAMFLEHGMKTIPASRTGLIMTNPVLHCWTDDLSGRARFLIEKVVPKPKLLKMVTDYILPTGAKSVEVVANTAGSAILKLILSIDGGVTWKAWNGSQWLAVNTESLTEVESMGMTKETINGITETAWDAIISPGGTIRFGIFRSQTATADTCEVDSIRVNFK